MLLRTLLKLGRVSNLPTVWTNGLAGVALASWAPVAADGLSTTSVYAFEAPNLAAVLLALSLFYVGGMLLNDAFDAEIDANERADRPIPQREIGRKTVFALGFSALAGGLAVSFLAFGDSASFLWAPGPGAFGLGIAVSVLLYDWLHKRSAFGVRISPLLMGLCRFLTYGFAAAAIGTVSGIDRWEPFARTAVFAGALGLFAHVVGLTYAARQEAYDRIGRAWPLAVLFVPVVVGSFVVACAGETPWPGLAALTAYAVWTLLTVRLLLRRSTGDVPTAVAHLIAGISLFDAAMIAATGAIGLSLVAFAGFGLTLSLQRIVPGT